MTDSVPSSARTAPAAAPSISKSPAYTATGAIHCTRRRTAFTKIGSCDTPPVSTMPSTAPSSAAANPPMAFAVW